MENKICFTCGKKIDQHKIFCTKDCYFKRSNYRHHSEETKLKIACSNSKPFTFERKYAISKAKLKKIDDQIIQKLIDLWEIGCINPIVIQELCGLKKRVYQRLEKEYCKKKQLTFMPSDWYPNDYKRLIELSNQGVWYKDISKILGKGQKQVINIVKKLGLPFNSRMPNPWASTISKLEQKIINWLIEDGYEVTQQFPLGNFFYDGHIKNTNVLIEVNGDYWHCNPEIYKDGPINDLQKMAIKRDFAKKAHSKKMGYYQITIWESDVYKKPNEIREWILRKIKENAINND